jgi:mutator protein MutT
MPDTPAIDVVVALIIRDRRVLMGERRRTKVYPLHWEFPGGKLEPGETHTEALRRELHEELGIDAKVGEHFFSELATYGNGMTYDIRYHLVRSFNGEIDNTEFERVGWFSQEELPSLVHLSGNDRILRKIAEEGIPH